MTRRGGNFRQTPSSFQLTFFHLPRAFYQLLFSRAHIRIQLKESITTHKSYSPFLSLALAAYDACKNIPTELILQHDNRALEALSRIKITDQWVFLGNPFTGLQVRNKARAFCPASNVNTSYFPLLIFLFISLHLASCHTTSHYPRWPSSSSYSRGLFIFIFV